MRTSVVLSLPLVVSSSVVPSPPPLGYIQKPVEAIGGHPAQTTKFRLVTKLRPTALAITRSPLALPFTTRSNAFASLKSRRRFAALQGPLGTTTRLTPCFLLHLSSCPRRPRCHLRPWLPPGLLSPFLLTAHCQALLFAIRARMAFASEASR